MADADSSSLPRHPSVIVGFRNRSFVTVILERGVPPDSNSNSSLDPNLEPCNPSPNSNPNPSSSFKPNSDSKSKSAREEAFKVKLTNGPKIESRDKKGLRGTALLSFHDNMSNIVYSMPTEPGGTLSGSKLNPKDGTSNLDPSAWQFGYERFSPTSMTPLPEADDLMVGLVNGNTAAMSSYAIRPDPGTGNVRLAHTIEFPAVTSALKEWYPTQATVHNGQLLVPEPGSDTIWRIGFRRPYPQGYPPDMPSGLVGSIHFDEGLGLRRLITIGDQGYAISSYDNQIYHFQIPLLGFTSYVSRLTHWDARDGVNRISFAHLQPQSTSIPNSETLGNPNTNSSLRFGSTSTSDIDDNDNDDADAPLPTPGSSIFPIFAPSYTPKRSPGFPLHSTRQWLARDLLISPPPIKFSYDRYRTDMHQLVGGDELYPKRFVFATSTSRSGITRRTGLGSNVVGLGLGLGKKVVGALMGCFARVGRPVGLFTGSDGVGDVITIFEVVPFEGDGDPTSAAGTGHRLNRCAAFQTSLKIKAIAVGPPGRHEHEDMYLVVGGDHVSTGKGGGIEMYVYNGEKGEWKLGWKEQGSKWAGLSSLAWWGGI